MPVTIKANVSKLVNEKLEALAERRYGDRGQEAINRLMADVFTWKLDYWDRYGQSWRDFLWLKVAFFSPIPWLRKIGWGKLNETYFD